MAPSGRTSGAVDRRARRGPSPRRASSSWTTSRASRISSPPVLRYEGFQVAVAATGRKALAAATSFRPHLVVLDVMLPTSTAFEVQRRLTADGLRVPTLFLTARDTTEDKVRGLTMGADDYVTKPFSLRGARRARSRDPPAHRR